MTVLITGSTGFIGSNLSKYLNKRGWPVISTCRDLEKAKKMRIKRPIKMDLNDPDMIRKVLRKYDPSVVIHLGAISSPNSSSSSLDYLSTNVLSTQVICEEMKDKRVVFASSVVVYGNVLYLDETAKINPTTLYGATKACCENLLSCHKMISNINYTALRLCAVVGPGMTHGAIKDIQQKVNGKECVLYGKSPGSSKPYIHIDDVCRFIEYCTYRKGREEIYNVCPSDNLSIGEIRNIFDPNHLCSITWDETKVWPGDNRLIKCDNLKFRSCYNMLYPTSKLAIQTLMEQTYA